MWQVFLYSVVNGKAVPFAEQGFDTQQEAMEDICEHLKIEPTDLVVMDEDKVDSFILEHTRNQWSTS